MINSANSNNSIHIKNPSELNKKIAKLKKDGINSLHIVADFDSTLTKAYTNGKKIPSTYAHIREGNYMPSDYSKRAHDRYAKYIKIEEDDNLSLEFRSEKMEEWWRLHWDDQIKSGMNFKIIQDIISKDVVNPREGLNDVLFLSKIKRVPFLIFSAGIGNIIEEFLKKEKLLTENVHIISNFFKFNKKGLAIDYNRPLIHTFNKSEIVMKNFPYHREIEEKKNVILLGDSIGDLGMASGMKHDCIIKIGFLNDRIEERLDSYSKNFDVVILNDGDMYYVLEMLKEIVS